MPPRHVAPLALAALASALLACAPRPREAASPRRAAPAVARAHAGPAASAPPTPHDAREAPPPPAASAPPNPPAAHEAPPDADAEAEAPLPPGFVRMPLLVGEGGVTSSGPVACGRFRVENRFDNPRAFEPRVEVRDEGGRKVYEARGRRYRLGGPREPEVRMALSVDACGDLTGDGVPELIMTESTLGAHCCYTHYVVSLTSPPKRLLMWEKGDGGFGLHPERLRPGPAVQLVSTELVMPPFDVDAGDPALSYAGIPGYPIVFDLVGGAFEARTFSFRGELRGRRQEQDAACALDPERCEGLELIDWGWALIVGDWDTRKAALVKDDWLRGVLDRRAPAMRALLRRQLGP